MVILGLMAEEEVLMTMVGGEIMIASSVVTTIVMLVLMGMFGVGDDDGSRGVEFGMKSRCSTWW